MGLLYNKKEYFFVKSVLTKLECLEILKLYPNYKFFELKDEFYEELSEESIKNAKNIYQLSELVAYDKFQDLMVIEEYDYDGEFEFKNNSNEVFKVYVNKLDTKITAKYPRELYVIISNYFDIKPDLNFLEKEYTYRILKAKKVLLFDYTTYLSMINLIKSSTSFTVEYCL